jgi:hypothetical protein
MGKLVIGLSHFWSISMVCEAILNADCMGSLQRLFAGGTACNLSLCTPTVMTLLFNFEGPSDEVPLPVLFSLLPLTPSLTVPTWSSPGWH